ncbi:MAG: hypothetical protein HY560_01970 [Gemmatimonadetes bacterium]|nr:hypothetical protein [Gemmatimonadota bacterium]
MTLPALLVRGEELHQALGREAYLTGSGLKETPEFQQIYDRFADVCSEEALRVARASGVNDLIEWVVDLRVGRRTARLEEAQLTWEQGAVLRVGEHEVPYLRAPIELANSPDREFRRALDLARVSAGASNLNGLRRERFAIEREEVLALGLGDYVATRSALAGIGLDALGRAAAKFLEDTEDVYREALGRLVRRRLGVPLDDLPRSDAAWAFRADRFDGAFDGARLVPTAMRQIKEMGIDPVQNGRIRFDTDERAGKQPRAFCVPVRVPHEVYLVLRPRGGHADYRTFWHEHGHAVHFASTDPELPFAARWLGDNSVTEGFAMLWDHLPWDPRWLARYSGLSPADARDLRFELAVGELFMLRRYAAKLGYELVLHRGDLDRMAPEYAERLTRATLFRYPEGDYLLDVDPGFYAARYLRAWQLQVLLASALTERFDEDWYRNPRAGSLVQHLMSRGQAENADQLAARMGGGGLSFVPVGRRLQAALD